MTDSSPKLGKIFIGGLSYETTDEKLRAYFGAYGSVTDAVVMKDPISRRSRGFGFITYADPACVDRALAQPNHVLDSRRVEAKRAVPRAESSRDTPGSSSSTPSGGASGTAVGGGNSANSSGVSGSSTTRGNTSASTSTTSAAVATKKIFVGGLHYETKDGRSSHTSCTPSCVQMEGENLTARCIADFKKYFEQFGKVVSAEVMFNRETNKSRGFGFVVFEGENSVELVLQNRNHTIDSKSVEVKRAVPRTDAPPSRSTSARGSFSAPSGTSTVTTPTAAARSISTTAAAAAPAATPSSSEGKTSTSTTTPTAAKSPPEEAPRTFAAVANGTLGGYAAAVRYGGRVPQTQTQSSSSSQAPNQSTLSSSSSTSNGRPEGSSVSPRHDGGLSESFEKVSMDDERQSQQQQQQSESFGQDHSQANPHGISSSGDQSRLNQSPPKMTLGSSSPQASLALGQESNGQWTGGYSSATGQYGGLVQQSRLQESDPSGQSSFQWHQQPQWQQWSHGRGLGQDALGPSSSGDQEQLSSSPSQQPSQQQAPPAPPSSSGGFFSMFGSSIGGSGMSSNADGGVAGGYSPGPWNSGGYGGSGLGMGMAGFGMGSMGLGMDNGMGAGSLMQGQQHSAFSSGGGVGMSESSMPPYGSSFGSSGLGSLNHDSYRPSHSSMQGMGGFGGMLGADGLNSGNGSMHINTDASSAPAGHPEQQQQPPDNVGLDYGSYHNPNAAGSQFQGYR